MASQIKTYNEFMKIDEGLFNKKELKRIATDIKHFAATLGAKSKTILNFVLDRFEHNKEDDVMIPKYNRDEKSLFDSITNYFKVSMVFGFENFSKTESQVLALLPR